jgi:hypothetical protein
MERVSIDQDPLRAEGIFPLPVSASARLPVGINVDGSNGRCESKQNREDGFGSVTTLVHPPVKGAYKPPLPLPYTPSNGSRSGLGPERLPKLNFPKFDGDNPKLWLSRCEDYFEMYNLEPHRWIKFATMHFVKIAARWLPSVESRLKLASWDEFAKLLLERFGR